MFTSLKSLVLSDINSGTKNYILKNNPEIFSQLENKALNYILSLDAPEYIKDDMKEIMANTSFDRELLIIESAKRIAGWKESEVNAKIFSDMYEIPLREIQKSLQESAQKLESMKELLKNDNYLKYLSHIRRLSHCMRWNQQSRIFPISVMSHLVLITFLAYILVMIENHNGKSYNM
jgi:5'-deoxynucleotidase YfbR-like HD superfamily hydrolase